VNGKVELSFKDGFQFGCGFFVAGLVYGIIMMVAMMVVFGVFGAGLLGAMAGL
jgi:hypothetical protein